MGSVAKSYMRKGFLIYEERLQIFNPYMTLQPIPSEFPYFIFYQCAMNIKKYQIEHLKFATSQQIVSVASTV